MNINSLKLVPTPLHCVFSKITFIVVSNNVCRLFNCVPTCGKTASLCVTVWNSFGWTMKAGDLEIITKPLSDNPRIRPRHPGPELLLI